MIISSNPAAGWFVSNTERMRGIRCKGEKFMFLFANLFAKLFEQINIPGLLWVIIEKLF